MTRFLVKTMNNEELQVESGNFTRIINPLIEELIKLPFKGCELAVALFIIRKTYGFNKTKDEISLTQFQLGLARSRQTIVTALKNLQLVNVARLVKQGDSKKHSNCWEINKYYNTWELVKLPRLVKRKGSTSLTEGPQLVYIPRHTIDNTKDKTKETNSPPSGRSECPEIFNQTIGKKNGGGAEKMGLDEFQKFWDSYPVKKKKIMTRNRFLKLEKRIFPKILSALEACKRNGEFDREKRYIQYPEKWLSQRRWEDEEEEVSMNYVEEAKALIAKYPTNPWKAENEFMSRHKGKDVNGELKEAVLLFPIW